jgi:dipeptidyl aminopeptidase/acylaminoacyl peptidase
MNWLTLTGRRHLAVLAGAALLACLVLQVCSAMAQDARQLSSAQQVHIDEVLESVSRGRPIDQVALSPDAKRLAWVEEENGGEEIRVAAFAAVGELEKSQRATAAAAPDEACDENEIAWSPDSASLAFFSNCVGDGRQPDLYLSELDGKPARRLTELHGYVEAPAFSPDGKEVAFLYVKGATRPAGALAAEKPPSGVIGEDDIEIQRVAITHVDADAPNAVEVTPAKLHVFEFDWSPDAKSLAYIAADPPGENNWWVAKLYTQEMGGTAKAILDPAEVSGPLHGLQIAVPRWSPDGKAIAFIGGLMSDQGVTGGDIYVLPSTGAQNPINLTAGRHESAAWIAWKIPGEIDYTAFAGGFSQFRSLDLKSTSSFSVRDNGVRFQFPSSIADGRQEMSLSYERGQFALIKSSFSEPPEIWYAIGVGAECSAPADDPNGCYQFFQVSHLNDGVKPAWGKTVSLPWTSDGFHVQGWLTLPQGYDPTRKTPPGKFPLIVEVHGGPSSAVVPRWARGDPLSPEAFSALGYFVLQPNPRGSYGQGEAFTQANRKDFGYGDLRDILAGVGAAEARYPIDPGRVGLTGWSYGGFMTMFATTQTHRFKAAVAGAGISDWLSYYGENSIDQWMIPFFGASVYDDPAVYAKSSAIDFIKQARTPTLVVVGDRDGECPAPQSFEFWHALRDLHVPTQLVVYPNEGHGFVNSAHRRDVLERAAEWFARYMPAGG